MAIDFARETALKILYDINEKGAYSNISINKYFTGQEIREIDRAFITELVYGTVGWKLSIDWIIEQFSSIKLKKISPWILNILRLGVYQLIYIDKIPESAAVNESVNLAKRYGHAASSKFVNGIMRNISKNRNNIKYPDKNIDNIRFLSVRYSYPEWMVREWVERFGEEFTEELLKSSNKAPDFIVRVNTLKTTKQELIDELDKSGIQACESGLLEEALIIKNPSSITRLDIFNKGYFQVQDESSMLVARVLDPKPGELVMDICSAPGGKATHIAEIMKNQGTVIARDIHEHKIKLIDDALHRLGLDIVKTELYDAVQIDGNYIGKADRVLVDAPCTGLGIIRRKPDIKWSRNLNHRNEITDLQLKILTTASKYVKHGGTLVYSTCTIEREENEDIVKAFTAENREFELVDISNLLPDKLRKETSSEGYIQLYPNIDNTDGFFIARMMRKESAIE